MRWLHIANVLLLGCLLAAGCGSGSSATVTVTASPGSSSEGASTGGVSSGGQTAAVDPQQAFDEYLAKVQALRVPGHRTERRSYLAIKDVNSLTVTDEWDPAGAQARRTAFTLGIVSSKLARIQAPAGLEKATVAYAGTWADDGHVYSDVSWALLHHRTFEWSTYENRWTASYRSVGRYRLALIAYAGKHHLTIPKWVHKLGV